MITYANLLGSQVYEIQEVWMGWEDLWYVNNVLKTLPKGLQFFHPVPPMELPKVMDLTRFHNPDALCCFAGVTFCHWCRKEGQNEGTIVNHLWTIHYKLGLVCQKCLCYSSVTLEAIRHHGQDCKQPKGSNTEEEGRGLNTALDSN